jgi:hypothetical protein
MTQLALLDNGSRIQYGNKIYKTSSTTGFQLLGRFLQANQEVIVIPTSKNGVFAFDGVKLLYTNLRSGNKRTFTENGRIGRFYLTVLKHSLAAQRVTTLA